MGAGCSSGDPGTTAGGSSTGPSSPANAVDDAAIRAPKVNGGINAHPLRRLGPAPGPDDVAIDPALVTIQSREIYQLGFDGMRITVPFVDRGSFLAAIPYVRAARALGIDAVVVLADFAGLFLAQALHERERREEVLQLYTTIFATPPPPVLIGIESARPRAVGRVAFEILNEPTHFLGVPPDVYVHEFLAPCFTWLHAADPDIIVVAAAEVGNIDGPARVRAMLEAGLENVTDRVNYHVYSRDVIPLLSANVRQIVWVTESGAAGTAKHLPWVRDTFPDILGSIDDATRIFYYDLFDNDPGVYRILDIRREGEAYVAVAESEALYGFFAGNVAAAVAGRPVLGFDTLVPDIRAYFPTDADIQAYDAVRGA